MRYQTDEITNQQDTINSRDIFARIESLQSQWEDPECPVCGETLTYNWETEEYTGHADDCESDTDDDLENGLTLDEWEELKTLCRLVEENNTEGWKDGVTLIRDSYFTEYCEELVSDIGDMPRELPAYIRDNINWEGVAYDLKVDYSSLDFDGETYWYRE